MSLQALLKPHRGYSESQGAYKARRKAANDYVRRHSHGRMLWSSTKAGTYRKAEHGPLR